MEKNCFNCGNFARYYMIRNALLVPVDDGVCRCASVHWKKRERAPEIKDCPHWVNEEKARAICKERIIDTLSQMNERLEEIALILKTDKN